MNLPSTIINNILDCLGETPTMAEVNMTTLLRQGHTAQQWLLTHYLPSWLELIGGLVGCDYPVARTHRVQLRTLGNQAEHINARASEYEQIAALYGIESLLRSNLRHMHVSPSERDLQWGIWARDVPMSIAHAFTESEFMNPIICEGIAPVCMLSAFLVSHVVTDDGVAEEISSRMFEEKPRALIELMRSIPSSPEA